MCISTRHSRCMSGLEQVVAEAEIAMYLSPVQTVIVPLNPNRCALGKSLPPTTVPESNSIGTFIKYILNEFSRKANPYNKIILPTARAVATGAPKVDMTRSQTSPLSFPSLQVAPVVAPLWRRYSYVWLCMGYISINFYEFTVQKALSFVSTGEADCYRAAQFD